MFLRFDWSPPALNSVDWTRCGKAHTCLYLTVQVRPQAMKSEELSVDLQAQIWGRVSAPEGPNEHSGLRHPHMEKVWKVLQRRMGETAQNEGYHSLNSRSLMWCRGTETSAGILNASSVSYDSLEKTSKSAFRANFEGSLQHAGGCSEQVRAKGPHFIYIWYQDQVLALIPFVVPLHHRHYTMKDPDAEAQCYKKQWVQN